MFIISHSSKSSLFSIHVNLKIVISAIKRTEEGLLDSRRTGNSVILHVCIIFLFVRLTSSESECKT